MSKQITFPLLEITTLLVVLFACVLVVVPGFDEYTTSMLFDQERSVTNLNGVASDTQPAFQNAPENHVAENKPLGFEITPDPQGKLERSFDDYTPDAKVDLESVLPDAELEMAPDSLVVPEADKMVSGDTEGLSLESSNDDFESALEGEIGDFATELGTDPPLATPMEETIDAEQFEEIVVEPIQQNDTQYDLPTEDAPGDWRSGSDEGTVPDVAQGESPDLASTLNSPPSSVIPLNEFVLPSKSLPKAQGSELPKIINLVGSGMQVQAGPSVVRMSELFKNDSRVISNPMFSGTADQRVVENRSSNSNFENPRNPRNDATNPSSRPYQIRTTALPAMNTKAGNDFVPQR